MEKYFRRIKSLLIIPFLLNSCSRNELVNVEGDNAVNDNKKYIENHEFKCVLSDDVLIDYVENSFGSIERIYAVSSIDVSFDECYSADQLLKIHNKYAPIYFTLLDLLEQDMDDKGFLNKISELNDDYKFLGAYNFNLINTKQMFILTICNDYLYEVFYCMGGGRV